MANPYIRGAAVIYRAQKFSSHPGPRAEDVDPAPNGDTYCYSVDKYWRVDEALPDGQIVVRTRRGKRHTLKADDPRLRPPSWWEWLFYWHRFPPVEAPAEVEAASGADPGHK
jgi:hypothetical protein